MTGEDYVGSLIRGWGADDDKTAHLDSDKHQVFALALFDKDGRALWLDGTGGIPYHAIDSWREISDERIVTWFKVATGLMKMTIEGKGLFWPTADAGHKPPGRLMFEGKLVFIREGQNGVARVRIDPVPAEELEIEEDVSEPS